MAKTLKVVYIVILLVSLFLLLIAATKQPCKSRKHCKTYRCPTPKVPNCVNGFCKCVR
uniref:Nodule cysteine-rich protein 15 n=1 Tax=Cicer arietinum TaxID=3827 RepID=A0A0U8TRI1_CICAR|nr:TPA_exp: nodule cysteine-rich protein 15 [Cicer arietinum]